MSRVLLGLMYAVIALAVTACVVMWLCLFELYVAAR